MHELPLHPLTITNLLLWPVENLLLPVAEWALPVAQSLPDIKDVPDAFVKNWMIMMGFAVMIFIQIWTAMRGGQVQKRDVSGTLTTKPETQHADKSEVDELKLALQSLREENRSQHNQAATAGANRVAALSEVVDSETSSLSQKIDAVQDKLLEKIEEGFSSVHDKLNAVAIQAARHDEALPHLRDRIESLTGRYNDAIPNIHKRIDDAMQRKSK
jgi:hypothetical protein